MMAYIGLGSNLSTKAGNSEKTLRSALSLLPNFGVTIKTISPFYTTAPIGPFVQPDYVNAVAHIIWEKDARSLLNQLHKVEALFLRERTQRWQARTLDLDLLDFDSLVVPDADTWERAGRTSKAPDGLILPHPRLHQRQFVLQPFSDIAPEWVHPVLKCTISELLAALPDQNVRRLD
ncbi:7,8-dihydro-6-hydroxymethylpterin-pyrophosphokina se [Iodidimonas gelatinilytica]|uniref:2-amino-4-hydroxy-6-hydroxymethyldihydropteridine pyrophosphokinase n=1 Tax=Iodidimonas gelatinilytica TaxID=1236966 RepID=A0A5A7MXH6_9PROT|nr:2-amino-4-hydroxy-6-hydroxymethyldihydropteridine diphosphokinase [Iodidimonas gelatinilytica]GEQ96543.1 7,8-dihydro-6-hydroxymethylpterin-pyrophosphokina se [Iodidimonas gelatinilytica]GER00135.1 7,8-dihydro-6-hydroxymethylpterin-pyrophosphokina se [Iodidimonas gelatinilytica]